MGQLVCAGAALRCSFGNVPSVLNVLPINRVMTSTPIATIMDNKPIVNIAPFGMCSSMNNPMVAAATAAALGALTPLPCFPVVPGPWEPGCSSVTVANMAALNANSKVKCAWGGEIEIVSPGQTAILIP